MRWFGWREWVLSGVGIGSFYAVLSWVGGFFRGLVSPSVGFLVCYILLQLKGQLFQILLKFNWCILIWKGRICVYDGQARWLLEDSSTGQLSNDGCWYTSRLRRRREV